MATSELIEALQALAHERKIDEFYLIERLEVSLAKSYERILDLEWDARVTIDRQTGHIYVYELVPVGEPDEETGEYSEFEERDVTPADVSRIAAQNAKGVIASIVREAGRQSIFEEFSGRVGDLVTGTVLQGTPDFTIIKIRDGVEAELPHYDQEAQPGRAQRASRRTSTTATNQRLKVLIIDVRDPRGCADAPKMRGEQARPAIVVSRTHPDLIRRRPLRDRGAGDLRRHGGDQVHRPRAGRALQDRGGLARGATSTRRAPASARRAAACAWWWRSCATSAWRRHPVGTRTRRRTWPTRCQAGEGDARHDRRGHPLRHRRGARRPAVAGHRQGGARTPASPRA